MSTPALPRYRSGLFWKDWFERVFWTAAETVVGAIPYATLDAPAWSIPVIATALAAVKGYIARHLVSPAQDSASTVSGV
jgi:hypothetical protein